MRMLTFLLALIGAPAPAATDAEIDRMIKLVVGEFSNRPLVDAAKAKGAEVPEPLRDVHHMFATEVAMPKLKGRAVYVEWRHDGPAGAISGQRVWAFMPSDRGIAMMFHTLKPSGRAILDGVTAPDAKTEAVTIADLRPYPDSCLIYYRPEGGGFVGENTPGACAFPRTGSTDETFKVDAVLKFMPDFHSERTLIWITKTGQPTPAPEDEEWVYNRIR
ncbi:MAG: hypothetical protein FJX59_04100 [Alphaproteobacteria bacterium]|nr:hypothetical protein [Alphaproteobacteria bacterium]